MKSTGESKGIGLKYCKPCNAMLSLCQMSFHMIVEIEDDVFINRWARSQCVENSISPTPEIQRKFLADLIFQIRFPLMSPKEISDGPMLVSP